MLSLTVSERLELKGRAHALNPVVMIGNAGLTDAVMKEIEISLKTHELIKIRVMAERPQREEIMETICNKLEAAPVQHNTGHLQTQPGSEQDRDPENAAPQGQKTTHQKTAR